MKTIGYHIVKSAYGLWLPGDDRGSWSATWDAEIGLTEPHTLHPGDPVRLRMSAERMKHPPVRWTDVALACMENTLAPCGAESDWRIAAASLEPTHVHLILTYTVRDIDNTCKWLADQCTKAIRKDGGYSGPVWAKGSWRGFIFEPQAWDSAIQYVQRHNIRRGVGPRPYKFFK
ncbi:MAG: hypothetical protein HKL95_02265 [Phycisphaerae bacterium]|nr:hypothetical protein [Phycisphaerae bacterium]